MKKKFIVLVASVLLLVIIQSITFSSYASYADKKETVCFDVSTIEVQKDSETATVVVSILNNPGFASADLHIECELTILEINSDVLDIFYSTKTGNINWSNAKNSKITGEIIEIVFAVPKDSTYGDLWDVQLQITEIIDEETNSVPCTSKNGRVSMKQSDLQEDDTTEPIVEPGNKPTFFEKIIALFIKIRNYIKMIFRIK